MWEACAIINPDFIRSKLNEFNQSIPEVVKYLREKAQVLLVEYQKTLRTVYWPVL